jgi:hypothetical protein
MTERELQSSLMLLAAEKGGVQGRSALANELAENSGVNDLLTGRMEKWFGKWKGVMTPVLTSLVVVLGVLTTAGCCIIPCV